MAVSCALGQTVSSGYQPATIMAVTTHQSSGQQKANVVQYDVSVKVGNTIYVILFTPLNGANTVTYATGDEVLVLVGSKSLVFNGPSGKFEMPILHRETPAAQSEPSKVPSQNFTVKLALTDAQQAEIKPILEQEAGQVAQLCANTELSRVDKLRGYENLVQTTDEQIKPLLSGPQLKKLRDLRKEQKQALKRTLAEQENSKQH
jgi:hypothetical protein